MSDELEQDLETAPIVDDHEFDEAEDPLAEPTDKDGNFLYGKPEVITAVEQPQYRVRFLPSTGSHRTIHDENLHDVDSAIKIARAFLICEDVSRYDRVQVQIFKPFSKWYARWTGCRFGSEIICVRGEAKLDITMCEAVLLKPDGTVAIKHEEVVVTPITLVPLNTSTYPGSGPTTPLFPNAMTDEQWAALGIDAQRKAVDAECARDHESPFKIPRIKALRRLTAWGLKEAKD